MREGMNQPEILPFISKLIEWFNRQSYIQLPRSHYRNNPRLRHSKCSCNVGMKPTKLETINWGCCVHIRNNPSLSKNSPCFLFFSFKWVWYIGPHLSPRHHHPLKLCEDRTQMSTLLSHRLRPNEGRRITKGDSSYIRGLDGENEETIRESERTWHLLREFSFSLSLRVKTPRFWCNMHVPVHIGVTPDGAANHFWLKNDHKKNKTRERESPVWHIEGLRLLSLYIYIRN